ncbi:hypothetical protein SAMN05443550_10955 [Pedobacter hartonius]|uniref:cAMP-binding domain of CRP or a regulatory subunit of cAMP-dependent protein kinases n=1 Tax=Pedobacter hartonius TaxID=425514 RepID=A0A1H4G5S6_9SPHI|nr:hypothetical protein SAMN05443550_10955 [Pedobacter hartonius]
MDLQLTLTGTQWEEMKHLFEQVSLKKERQLTGKTGDLFYVVSGFLIENQNLGLKHFTMVRFFQQHELFTFPKKIMEGEIIATENTVLLKMSVKKISALQNTSAAFCDLWKIVKKEAAGKYYKRLEFLQGFKHQRFDHFQKQFPAAAASIRNIDLCTYLDINKTYFSTIRKPKKTKIK